MRVRVRTPMFLGPGGWGLVALIAMAPRPALGQAAADSLRIEGFAEAREGVELQWVAVFRDRSVVRSTSGYQPVVPMPGSGATLPVEREQSLEYRWSFGDRPGTISTGERPSVTHAFSDDGDFTIRVEAWSGGQLFAAGEREIRVANREPAAARIGAIQIEPNGTRFEFTGFAMDVDADSLRYAWDFGDGATLETDQWRVEHAFPGPGRYAVSLRIRDKDGAEVLEEDDVVVAGVGEDQPFQPLEARPTDAATTGIRVVVSGAVDFEFVGRIRPVAGLHFSSLGRNRPCRFMFSAWDDAHLAHLSLFADLREVVEDGAIYTIRRPSIRFALEDTRARYEAVRRGLTGGGLIGSDGFGGLLQSLLPGVENLPPEVLARVRREAGVDPRAVEEPDSVTSPPTSPFGAEERETFVDPSGEVDLLFIPNDRAGGRFEVGLSNSDVDSPFDQVHLSGEFSMDLQVAQRDGMLLYSECGAAPLEIQQVLPRDGDTFVTGRRPMPTVYFSKEYAAETLDTDNFRLTYPAPGLGEPVPVPVRLFRQDNRAWIQPVDDLKGGVRYTAWVKTGWDGVLDPGGNEIEDEDGTGWYTWSFWTRPDFAPEIGDAPGAANLSCHVFQSVRDVPLVAGKPAVARVYADWRRHDDVNFDAQLEEFTARVSLRNGSQEIAATEATFVRPDLWGARGVDLRAAEHTAQVYFTPSAGMPPWVRVQVEYPTDPGESAAGAGWSSCATPIWDHAPTMTVQWFLVDVNQWRDVDIDTAVRAWVGTLMGRVTEFAEGLLPLSAVEARYGGVIPWPATRQGDRWAPHRPLENCNRVCVEDVMVPYWEEDPVLAAAASASPLYDEFTLDPGVHLWLFLHPARSGIAGVEDIRGGNTLRAVGDAGPAKVTFAVEEDPQLHARVVEGIVHEMGHALWLEHLPFVGNDNDLQDEAWNVRTQAWANGTTIEYPGIEGFLLAPGGGRGWNKSSSEGNGESGHLVPLMYPASIPMRDAFIARHQYLRLMRELEERGGLPGGG